jgi:hypothetical protein
LTSLVAARQEDHQQRSASNEVHAMTGPSVDAQFEDALPDRPRVSGVAK